MANSPISGLTATTPQTGDNLHISRLVSGIPTDFKTDFDNFSYNYNNIAYVDINGNNTTGTVGNASKPFQNIANAVAAISVGGLVVIYPGTYDEFNLLSNGKDLYFIRGAAVICSTAGQYIFNDAGGAVSAKILGYGIFSAAFSASGSQCLNITNASSDVYMETTSLSGDRCILQTDGKVRVKLDGDAVGSDDPAIDIRSSSDFYIEFTGDIYSSANSAFSPSIKTQGLNGIAVFNGKGIGTIKNNPTTNAPSIYSSVLGAGGTGNTYLIDCRVIDEETVVSGTSAACYTNYEGILNINRNFCVADAKIGVFALLTGIINIQNSNIETDQEEAVSVELAGLVSVKNSKLKTITKDDTVIVGIGAPSASFIMDSGQIVNLANYGMDFADNGGGGVVQLQNVMIIAPTEAIRTTIAVNKNVFGAYYSSNVANAAANITDTGTPINVLAGYIES